MAEWMDRHKGEADRHDPRTARHFGSPEYWGDENNIRKHSPAHQLRPLPPKTLLVQGSEDTTVPYEYAEQFLKQLRAHGGEAELALFKGAPHRFHDIPQSPFYEPSMKAVEAFLVRAFGLGNTAR
jgi:dipeptidyl aminopeptidase/acylaminoacyl peptidase